MLGKKRNFPRKKFRKSIFQEIPRNFPRKIGRWSHCYQNRLTFNAVVFVAARGAKAQPAKTNLPPRFQRQQQQHGYDEPAAEPAQPSHSFRRRGSGRRSGDADDKLWRRNSSAAPSTENGEEAEQEMVGSSLLKKYLNVARAGMGSGPGFCFIFSSLFDKQQRPPPIKHL
jgi:hypothetical protein